MPNAMEKVKRPLIAHFLDTAQSDTYDAEGATWARIGVNVTDMSIDYGAQTETVQDIISRSATTDITSYQPTAPVSQQCTKGEPIFEFITNLRRKRAIMGDARTWLMNVDLWDSEPEGTYAAEVQEVSIQVDTYGGAGGESPVQEYTINFIGDPISGTATIVGEGKDAKPTFSPAV